MKLHWFSLCCQTTSSVYHFTIFYEFYTTTTKLTSSAQQGVVPSSNWNWLCYNLEKQRYCTWTTTVSVHTMWFFKGVIRFKLFIAHRATVRSSVAAGYCEFLQSGRCQRYSWVSWAVLKYMIRLIFDSKKMVQWKWHFCCFFLFASSFGEVRFFQHIPFGALWKREFRRQTGMLWTVMWAN